MSLIEQRERIDLRHSQGDNGMELYKLSAIGTYVFQLNALFLISMVVMSVK
jgi:hypothetical protein